MSHDTQIDQAAHGTASPPRRIRWADIAVVSATAAFCATLTWTVLGPLGGVDMEVRDGAGHRGVGVVAVIASTLLVSAVGGALLRWRQGRSPTATRNWTILAVTFAVLSLLGPTSAVSVADSMSLVSLHAVVAAAVIVGLRRAALHLSRCIE